MDSEKLEDLLEALYWEFDDQRSKNPENERILFKGKLRWLITTVKYDGQ